MNLYFEKNVINEEMQSNPAKGKRYEFVRIAVIVLMIILLIVLANSLHWTDNGWFFNIVIFISVIAFCLTIILFCGQQLKKHCCEFDYIISNNELKIIRIYNQRKRETILTFDISNIEHIGFASEEAEYKDYEAKSSKKCLATCNSNENYLYIYGTVKSTKTLLVCEYDSDFILALKKSVASYGVFSEEFKKFKD